jgi:hypothetical protein
MPTSIYWVLSHLKTLWTVLPRALKAMAAATSRKKSAVLWDQQFDENLDNSGSKQGLLDPSSDTENCVDNYTQCEWRWCWYKWQLMGTEMC